MKILLLLLLPLTVWAQDGPITSLPTAPSVDDSDWLVIDDGVTTQKAARSDIALSDAEVAATPSVTANTAKRSFPIGYETKVDSIADGAEVNVQADWNEADSGSDAFIQNKPTIPSDTDDIAEAGNLYYTEARVTANTSVTANTAKRSFPLAYETKVDSIADGAEVNVQADWNEADSGDDAFIQNKPTIPDTSGLEEEGEINVTVITGNAVDNSSLIGTGANAAGWVTLPSCSDESETLGWNTTTGAWVCNTDAGSGGGMTSFTIDGDTGTSNTITDGETLSIDGDTSGIDTVVTANTITISYDATEAESANESAIDLQDLQGAVTDGQVPNTITVDLAATVTTNANLTGPVTSSGNATTITADSINTGQLDDGSDTPLVSQYIRVSSSDANNIEYRTAAETRSDLNVDVSGTDNSTNVTIAAGLDYVTISGQELTLGSVDLTTDVTGALPGGNIAAGAIGSSQIADNAVDSAEIATDAVQAAEIDADAVGTSELDDGTDTPASGEWVQVDTTDQAGFSYRTDTEAISDLGIDADITTLTIGASATVNGSNTGDESSATTSAEGIVELATTAEATTGTDTARVVTPDALADSTFTDSAYWPGGSLVADGTQCSDPAKATINSGPALYSVICTDNAASIFYGSVTMPDGYDGGTVTFELAAIQTAADTNVLDFDFSGQCRGDSDTVNSTWGTAQNASITFATANDIEHATTAAVTPNGTCAAGDTLFWRAVMDNTATTTAVATAHIVGVKMEYTTVRGD